MRAQHISWGHVRHISVTSVPPPSHTVPSVTFPSHIHSCTLYLSLSVYLHTLHHLSNFPSHSVTPPPCHTPSLPSPVTFRHSVPRHTVLTVLQTLHSLLNHSFSCLFWSFRRLYHFITICILLFPHIPSPLHFHPSSVSLPSSKRNFIPLFRHASGIIVIHLRQTRKRR